VRSLGQLRSPSFVLALVALSAALGGAAYAGVKIGSSQIKNGAITKKKLAKNSVASKQVVDGSLTGADINQGTLDQVANANTATTAGSVGGMKVEKFSFRGTGGLSTIATVGSLEVRAGCGAGQPLLSVTAASGAQPQTVRASVIKGVGTIETAAQGTLPPAGIAVLDGSDTDASYNGTIDALTLDNKVTTIQWAARSTAAFPSPNPDASNCLVWGTASSG